MKKTLLILIALLIAVPAFASAPIPKYRAYYPKTQKTYYCDSVYWGTLGTYCYSFVKGVLVSHGVGTLQEWTGLYDSHGVKEYEGDIISSPGIPNGMIFQGSTSTFVGWFIVGTDGKFYSFTDLSGLPKSQWSTVL